MFCEENRGCIYRKFKKNVLIAYDADYIVRNCSSVDLVIQFGEFVYPKQCIKQYISYNDIKNMGSYFIWVTNNKIKIDKISGNRMWNTHM
ncbi:MAG: hypothetical protein ACTJLM_00755 [Ehrlichia sp.]